MAERCAGLIHSDFNDHNILVQPEDTKDASCGSPPAQRYSVCAILDFGDSTKSFLIIEIAIAMNYMTLLCPPDLDPDEMSGHALAGYLSEVSDPLICTPSKFCLYLPTPSLSLCLSATVSLPPSLPPSLDRLVGLVVRRPPRERKIPGSNPACAGIFSGSSHTSDSKIGTPAATLPGAWRYRVSAGTGRPGVSIL